MLSRLSELFWGKPPVTEVPFKPHRSWLLLNQAHRERAMMQPGNAALVIAAPLVPQIPLNSFEERDQHGNSRLIHAIANQRNDEVVRLLACGADIEGRGFQGFTPLAVAAYTGNLEAARILLAHGAKYDVWSTREVCMTPLTAAIRQNHVDLVRVLIAAGADVDACESTTFTPLMLAAGANRREMLGMLLQAGANRNEVASDGSTAESIALLFHHEDLIELLHMDRYTLRTMDFSDKAVAKEPALTPAKGGGQCVNESGSALALNEQRFRANYMRFYVPADGQGLEKAQQNTAKVSRR